MKPLTASQIRALELVRDDRPVSVAIDDEGPRWIEALRNDESPDIDEREWRALFDRGYLATHRMLGGSQVAQLTDLGMQAVAGVRS